MSDSLIRIQCLACRTDIIFITDAGRVEPEAGDIYSRYEDEIIIHCNICRKEVSFHVS